MQWSDGTAAADARIALLGASTLLVVVASGLSVSSRPWLASAPALAAIGLTLLAARPGVPCRLLATGAGGVVRLLLTVALVLASSATLAIAAIAARGTAEPHTDAAAFNAAAARLTVEGVNPYGATDAFRDVFAERPTVPPTPLRRGTLEGRTDEPTREQMLRDVHRRLERGEPLSPEYSSTTFASYPALAFLVQLPSVWLGTHGTLLVGLLALAGFAAVVLAALPARLRLVGALVVLGNTFALGETFHGGFELLALLPALLAWRWFDRTVLSGVLLGVACAVKQVAWPLWLLAAAIAWRQHGARDAVRRSGFATAAFLVPNLPFVVADPAAWLSGVLAPVRLPMFPEGVGAVVLSTSGVLPLPPAVVYAVAEVVALLGLAAWYAVGARPPRRELALVLGLLPFLLAWRSLLSYVWLLPALGLYAAAPLLRSEVAARRAAGRRPVAQAASALPVST